MALFGTPTSFVGVDVGTSSLKIVELVNRNKRLEVTTYAQANLPNMILQPQGDTEDAIRRTANILVRLMDEANVSTDAAVTALPSSIVFSTVLQMPPVAEKDMEKAVRFAARDIIPADLDDTVLGWSRVGELPHMGAEKKIESAVPTAPKAISLNMPLTQPIFVTAAPKDVVERYMRLMELAQLDLVALEVETFPLVRSLLASETDSALIVDIGDQVTTYHVIDVGTPRVSFSSDVGGQDVTQAIQDALRVNAKEAEVLKVQHGLGKTAPENLRMATMSVAQKIMDQAQQLLERYARQSGRAITKTVLIGGGANLKGLAEIWSTYVKHKAVVGNPWKGLAYPKELEIRMQEIGPRYSVAVGLAERQIGRV